MAIPIQQLKDILSASFPDATIDLNDMLGDSDHYGLIITCASFDGLSRVKRHQMVYKALGSIMGNELHALSFKTLTPTENKKDLA